MCVISSRNGRTFRNFPTLNACKKKKKVIRCDGLIYDFIVKGITKCPEKSISFGCHGYLLKWESNVQCHIVGDRYFALTSRYFIAISLQQDIAIVLLIVHVSQVNWLSCQIFEMAKQALDFVRDGNFWWFYGRESISVDFMIKCILCNART